MTRRLLSFILTALLVATVVGCGDTVNFNSNSTTTTNGNNLSGQTGTVTVQTQLAANQIQAQQALVIQSDIIPSFVDELRFIGQDQNGFLIYGPVVQAKATTIELQNVPVEVVTLRIELLVNGFAIGGLVAPVNVPSGETVFITDPVYVFAGAESDVDTAVAYGSFRNIGDPGTRIPFPDGEFPAAEAPVIDFPHPQVTNAVSRTGDGLYTVTQDGDYLLTYAVELEGSIEFLLTQLIVNGAYVANTQFDVADSEFFFIPGRAILGQVGGNDSTALQSFQHIVTLQAGDVVSLNVRDFFDGRIDNRINAQQIRPVFFIEQGTFSIIRLGSGGVTAPAPPTNPT
jgi:hypothetical protein